MDFLKQPETYALLRQIRSYNIEVLINDLQLLEDGYVINYIIDPFDIFRFSFPYGLRFQHTHRPLDEIGDEMIAYTYLFKNYKPIILDEYKLELFVNRNHVYTNISDNVNKNLFEELKERLKTGSNTMKSEVYRELSESATFLLASSHLTRSFIDRFDFIFKQLQIDTFELEPRIVETEQIILQAFADNRRSDWSAEAFKKWVKEKDAAGEFNGKTPSEISKEFENTYRDYVVIDRVCKINKQLQENRSISGKYLFLYFSSANKSSEIFSKDETKDHLPTINGKARYDILRSAKHLYLLFLFADRDRENIIRSLTRLKKIAKRGEEEKRRLTNIDSMEFLEEFEDIKNRLRGGLEEESIKRQVQQHTEYQESLKETINKLKHAKHDLPELKKLYEDLLQKAKTVSYNINSLTNMEIDYSIQSSLSILVKLLVDQKELNLHKGLDHIAGNYQHLPILLFLDTQDSINSELRTLLYEVINFVVKSPQIRAQNLMKFFDNIKELYTKSEKQYVVAGRTDREDLYYSGVLIKSLIYLILPFKDGGNMQEKEVYTFISDTFAMLKIGEQHKDSRLTDTYKLLEQRKKSFDKWQYDYRYFLIWATRRNKQIKDSLKEAEDAIKRNPHDPRFHHGKCLALHNQYTSNNLDVVRFDCLQPLIESAEIAISLYKEKTHNTSYMYQQFIEGSIVALQNTILYSVSLSHLDTLEHNTKNPLMANPQFSKYSLEYLRDNLLNSIKTFKNNNQVTEEYPEISHTESVLKLCEAISNFNSHNSSGASNEISRAVEAITNALRINPKSTLYKETKRKIDDWEIRIKG